MLEGESQAIVNTLYYPTGLNEVKYVFEKGFDFRKVSAVSHEVTASILSALLGFPVPFNRVNLLLGRGDVVYCLIPSFRAEVAREFTRKEIEDAGIRIFRIAID
jgi:hypothetical protein